MSKGGGGGGGGTYILPNSSVGYLPPLLIFIVFCRAIPVTRHLCSYVALSFPWSLFPSAAVLAEPSRASDSRRGVDKEFSLFFAATSLYV